MYWVPEVLKYCSANHPKPVVFLWKCNCVLVCDFFTYAHGRYVPKSQTSTHIVFLFCFVNNTLLICLVHSVHACTLALGVHYGRFEKVACGPCHLVTIWKRLSRGWSQSNGCVRKSTSLFYHFQFGFLLLYHEHFTPSPGRVIFFLKVHVFICKVCNCFNPLLLVTFLWRQYLQQSPQQEVLPTAKRLAHFGQAACNIVNDSLHKKGFVRTWFVH